MIKKFEATESLRIRLCRRRKLVSEERITDVTTVIAVGSHGTFVGERPTSFPKKIQPSHTRDCNVTSPKHQHLVGFFVDPTPTRASAAAMQPFFDPRGI
ncbi:hypothetical protein TNCV_1505111 [Trichonephila clavipes]|nr:hypothetical protein TNCV_1505111 [Trichonephila clavipes]